MLMLCLSKAVNKFLNDLQLIHGAAQHKVPSYTRMLLIVIFHAAHLKAAPYLMIFRCSKLLLFAQLLICMFFLLYE